MILPIDTQYRLCGDRHSWIVQKRRKRNDRRAGTHVAGWDSILWCTTLEEAINSLADLKIRTSDAQTLAEALAEVEKVTATVCQALAPQFKVAPTTPCLTKKGVRPASPRPTRRIRGPWHDARETPAEEV